MTPEKTKAEKEIAQSTGNETDKWADKLEKEAEDIIKERYHSDDKGEKDDEPNTDKESDDDDDSKKGDGTDEEPGDDKDKDADETKDDDKDDKANTDTKSGDDDSDDNIETLRTDRDRFQKQAKDNKSEYTRGQQKLKEAQGRTEEMEDTIFNLRNKLDDLASTAKTKTEEKKVEKEIKADLAEVSDQLKAINDIDPDIGKAMTPVIEGLLGKIANLETQVKDSNASAKKTSEEIANDAHFSKLDRAVPNWEDTVKSEEFVEYVDNLSPRQKRMALSDLKEGSAADIIEVISDYTASLPETKKANNKKDKVKQASDIANPDFKKSKETKTSKTFKFTISEIDSMNEKDYLKNEADIDKAWAKGEIDLNN